MTNFSNDADLLQWEPDLTRYLPENQADYLPQHTAAKAAILRDLIQDKVIANENQIGNAEELRLVSTFKTLEIIMNFLSANLNDRWAEKRDYYAKKYSTEYEDAKNALTVDADEDGVIDDIEAGANNTPILGRW